MLGSFQEVMKTSVFVTATKVFSPNACVSLAKASSALTLGITATETNAWYALPEFTSNG